MRDLERERNKLQMNEKKIIAELETALKQWETAFNAKDAVALAKLYDVNTDVIYDNDVHHRNRKSLQKQFVERFAKEANQKQTITEVERKILTRRIVIETGVWENAGSSDTTRAQRGRYSCTWMKKKGKWLIVHDRGWGVTKKK